MHCGLEFSFGVEGLGVISVCWPTSVFGLASLSFLNIALAVGGERGPRKENVVDDLCRPGGISISFESTAEAEVILRLCSLVRTVEGRSSRDGDIR